MNILSIITFFLNPILALPFNILEIINRKKYAAVLFSITMGLLAFVLIPNEGYDLIRVYERYDLLHSFTFLQLIDYLSLNLDFTFYLYSWFLGKLNLPKELLPFTAIFLIYLITFTIYINWSKESNPPKAKRIIFFIFVLFFVPFLSTYSGIRNNTALALFSFGLYMIITNQKRSGVFYVILANITHFMTLILSVLLVTSFLLKNHKLIKKIFILSFVLLLLPSNPIVDWLANIDLSNEALEQRQFSYLGGSGWSDFFLPGLSFQGRIFFIITMLPYYFSVLYLLSTKNESQFRNYIYLIGILTNIFSSVPGTLYKRYCIALVFIVFILLLYEYRQQIWCKLKIKFIYVFISIFLLGRLADIYTSREMVKNSFSEILTYNFFTYFNQEINVNNFLLGR